jgi:NADPH2:quinone reductase
MPKAIRMHAPGGPEVLSWDDIEVGDPGDGEVRLRQTAVGLNYIDVEAVGPGVENLREGDRVAYATLPLGAYAEARVIPAGRVVKLPGDIDDRTGAAMMLQGMTVEYLIRRTYPVQPGDTVLWQAAAGGVGLIACQWLKHIGATVIGTVGSAEKGELAKAHGCDHIINYREENFVERVRELTDGAGVPVVYDGVGKDTFDGSLDCLRPRGMMVIFGAASGPVPPFETGLLAGKGSLYLTRPTLMTYTAADAELADSAAALIDVVQSGAVKIEINQTYPLSEAAQAHADLEGRKTTGSTVFVV